MLNKLFSYKFLFEEKKIQAHHSWCGLEHPGPAPSIVGHAHRLYPVLWSQYRTLYHLSFLRKSGLFVFQRIHQPGHDVPHGERLHFHEDKYSQISVSLLEKRTGPDQLWFNTCGVFRVLSARRHYLYLEICAAINPYHFPASV